MRVLNLVKGEYNFPFTSSLIVNRDLYKDTEKGLYFRLLSISDAKMGIRIFFSDDNILFSPYDSVSFNGGIEKSPIFKATKRYIRFEINYLNATYISLDAIFSENDEKLYDELDKKLNQFLVLDNFGTGFLIETNRERDYITNSVSPFYYPANLENTNEYIVYDLLYGFPVSGGRIIENTSLIIDNQSALFLTGRVSFQLRSLIAGRNVRAIVTYPDRFIVFENTNRFTIFNSADYSIFILEADNTQYELSFPRIGINDFDFYYSPTEYKKRKIII